MKKSLLTLGLLGLGFSAFAQIPTAGPWTAVNTVGVNSSPNYLVSQLVTISPTFCWAVMQENVAASPRNSILITNANLPAGTQFDFNSIAGTTGYVAASISPVNTTTAFCAQYTTAAPSSGEVIRTNNGGATWRRVTASTNFAAPSGFANWVHMFSATEGVAFGDPNPLPPSGPGVFEFIRTTNANVAAPTWTRITANIPAPLDADEYGLADCFTSLGSSIWAGTNHVIGGVDAPARILRTIDRGLTWTAYTTPLLGSISAIAFKDQNNGIAFRTNAIDADLIRTTDGGVTWTPVPLPAGRDTLAGKFYRFGIDAVPGVGFFSVGQAVAGSPARTNYGVSFSVDGITWKDVERGGAKRYAAVDFINCSTNPTSSNTYQGYLGGYTARATASPSTPGGQGGIYQVSPAVCAVLSAKRNSELQRSLTVSPNPSASGVFSVSLAAGIKAGTVLTVFDVMGRVVSTRVLNATAVDSKTITLDLSGQKTGVYTLRLSDAGGIATEKLVIE